MFEDHEKRNKKDLAEWGVYKSNSAQQKIIIYLFFPKSTQKIDESSPDIYYCSHNRFSKFFFLSQPPP